MEVIAITQASYEQTSVRLKAAEYMQSDLYLFTITVLLLNN